MAAIKTLSPFLAVYVMLSEHNNVGLPKFSLAVITASKSTVPKERAAKLRSHMLFIVAILTRLKKLLEHYEPPVLHAESLENGCYELKLGKSASEGSFNYPLYVTPKSALKTLMNIEEVNLSLYKRKRHQFLN